MEQALALPTSVPQTIDPASEFDLHDLRIFTSIPDHRDYGVVAMHGMVVVYDLRPIYTEGIVEGAFYVRESQSPAASRRWSDWLRDEWNDSDRGRIGPNVPLTTRREVVQAVRWPAGGTDSWAARLSSGFTDGPYYDWWFGRDFVGKVVGVYRPQLC